MDNPVINLEELSITKLVNEAHPATTEATPLPNAPTPDTTVVTPPKSQAQQDFDRMYITTTEIYSYMGVCRATLLAARRRGFLPEPIVVNDTTHIWRREDIQAKLEAWKLVRSNGN